MPSGPVTGPKRRFPSHNATLTLCLAAAAGVFLVITGRRLHIPSIVLLFAGGIALGPEVLGWIDPGSVGGGLETLIALAVAVILFEGGLTLDLDGYRRAPVVIRRLLTLGPLVTWLGTSAAVLLLFGLEPGMALMAGSLVIVTGPTVVLPLLRRIRIKERLHHVLYWEGVLIDAVGVFVAVLCYEWLMPDVAHPLWQPLGRFGLRILVGIGLGAGAGFAVAFILNRLWVSKEHTNIFVLACALLTFGVAHVLLAESGILAVVVAGLVVGLQHPPQLEYVRRFELQLTELGIGALFILLSAKLELAQFAGWRLLALLAVVIVVLRPVAVWLATWGQQFEWREKLFLSWIAPRGIVAAAMASLFAVRLRELGHPEAVHLETFTYAIIATTVTLQGLSAPWIARLLGIERRDHRTWVLVGDSALVKPLGGGLRRAGVKVLELSGLASIDENIDPDAPRFADTQAVLCAHTTMLQNVWAAVRLGLRIREDACFRLATFEPEAPEERGENEPAGRAVWASTVTAAAVVDGLESGRDSIDVVEIGKQDEQGRFGNNLQPLFWVKDGHAHIIVNPRDPGPPRGDLAVVLRRRVTGLANLIAHVEIIEDRESSFTWVLQRLAETATRLHPELPIDSMVRGIIDRRDTMPAAVGGGVAIPHAYCDGLDRSRCFLAVVPHGVVDMVVPDELPVRLVFLLISPQGWAARHLESLAALASFAQEPGFIDLLCRQRVPQRLARLISERA